MDSIALARRIVVEAITAGVFPSAAVEVGASGRALWHEGFSTAEETPFDLASLTKVIATTTVVMQLVEDRRIDLTAPISAYVPEWQGRDRETVIIQDLMEHGSGLPARLLEAAPGSRRELEHDIATSPLEYAPRQRSIYSDLGFILLGFIAADRGERSLSAQFDAIRDVLANVEPTLATAPLAFTLTGDTKRRAAPTLPMPDDPRRGRTLIGDVHDNYASALHGIAGHSGLFGTAASVGAFARCALRAARGDRDGPPPFSAELMRRVLTKSLVPGSSRALGWDTMLPTSSCGERMSASAFGHVGFTGTSLWIDPAADRYFVLLTNRAGGSGSLDQMRSVRRAFHDALADI